MTRNVKKSLAGIEDLLLGIGTAQQARGEVSCVNVFPSSYNIIDMQSYGGQFFRLYGSDRHYTDYRRDEEATVGIPGLQGAWLPVASTKVQVVGNNTHGAFLYDNKCAVYDAVTDKLYSYAGSLPLELAPGYDIGADANFRVVPAAVVAGDLIVWVDSGDNLRVSEGLPASLDPIVVPPASTGFRGQHSMLNIVVSGVGYAGTVAAGTLVVADVANASKTLYNISLSFNAAVNGANGLDTGTVVVGKWYNIFVIADTVNNLTATIVSESAVPTLPAGYTMWARVGSAYSLATTFMAQEQFDDTVSFGANSNQQGFVSLVNGLNNTVLTALDMSSAMPPTAKSIALLVAAASGTCAMYTGTNLLGGSTSTAPTLVWVVPKVPRTVYWRMTNAGSGIIRAFGYVDRL